MMRTLAESVPPAAAVLVACGRDPADPRTPIALRDALARVTDWGQLGEAAMRHGMAGLLHRRVVGACPDAVPGIVLGTWRQRALVIAQRSLRMQRQLLALLESLTAGGVQALVLKGPAFSRQLYGDADLRHFTDLDVLVRPGDVAAARDVALANGFVDRLPFDIVSEAVLQTGEQEIGFAQPTTGLLLDLHWRVGPRFAADSLPADELFARADRLELLGREITVLGRLDVALALTVHAATNEWPRFEDVAGAAAALRRLSAAEAAALETLAKAHACRRRLHVGVLLAATLAQSRLPTVLAAPAFSDRLAKELAAWAGARLLWSTLDMTTLRERAPLERARGALWQARSLDTSLAMARHLWHRFFALGVHDWSECSAGGAEAQGLHAAAAVLRRQRRLWRR
jgi:hypothetical protein